MHTVQGNVHVAWYGYSSYGQLCSASSLARKLDIEMAVAMAWWC